MQDPRHEQLAEVLVNYSCKIQPGENVLIQAYDIPIELVEAVVMQVAKAGGNPLVDLKKERLLRALLENATEESLTIIKDVELYRMKKMDAFIGIRGWINPKELSDLPAEKTNLYQSIFYQKVHSEVRVPDTKWVVLRYPTSTMAYMSKMSTVKFEEFYYNVTTKVDYKKMSELMNPAVDFLKKADQVKILGKGTDLTFSIKGIGAVKCCGERNIPDGEVYSCPIKDTVNGKLLYNSPSTYHGFTFENIELEFKDGKIIKATANDTKRINEIFDIDEGSRYIGEFALGCNPYITQAIDESLFDEKISGSFHFTPGNAYDETDNGNRSAVHWDLVCIQTPEYGGGEIWIDNQLIRKDGVFVHEAFQGLNPENMKK
ncbi:MAG: aminopeptidase [Spirochaetes bacterium]|nr:aminopeptidase [Spirochaetota bacterium]